MTDAIRADSFFPHPPGPLAQFRGYPLACQRDGHFGEPHPRR